MAEWFVPDRGSSTQAPNFQASPTAYLRSSEGSKAEAQSDGGVDVVALEKAESQSAVNLREHQSEIDVPLRREPPIDRGGHRIERARALRVLGAGAGSRPAGCGAEEGILDVVVIGADHIEVLGNRVLGPDPHDLHSLVAEAVHAERGIVDGRVVDRVTSQANAVFDPVRTKFHSCGWRATRPLNTDGRDGRIPTLRDLL